MNDYPRLGTPIILLIVAVILLLIAKDASKLPDWLRFGVATVGVIFAFAGVLSGVNWLTYNVTARAEEMQRARALTPEIQLADRRLLLVEKIASMPQDRIATLAAFAMPIVEFVGGSIGPIPMMRVGEGSVPMWFVSKFWTMSTDEYLVPVRTWNSETKERQWAEALTNYLCNFGLALPAAGNNPAKWTSAENAHRWLFGDVG